MANALNDLTGVSFGRLTVVARAENDKFGSVYWRCRCDCGELVVRRANTLRDGKFFTCGKSSCRFWEKVHVPSGEGCWEWLGAVKDTGYGVLRIPGQRKNALAHVFSWELHKGDAKGLWVLHRCDNRRCVRPDHLFLGTHADNMKDMAEKGRSKSPRPQLAKDERVSLLAELSEGQLTYGMLSEKYGVSTRTITRIARSC